MLVVQHMAEGFIEGFVEWLDGASQLAVQMATDGERLQPGHVYVAPDDRQMGVRRDGCLVLTDDGPEHGLRPSVSYLFRSLAAVQGARAIAVLLSGMGRDGAEALAELKAAGAITIAQDAASSVVHGMPGAAIELGAARYVLSPELIIESLTREAAGVGNTEGPS